MKICELTQTIIDLSEKAGRIARAIRADETLFSLLVEEKEAKEANKRFYKDFKTLADVLIQETIKHELGQKFPGILDIIRGEETNKFTNTDGESIEVAIQANEGATKDLLAKVLNGQDAPAAVLAKVVHEEVKLEADEDLEAVAHEVEVSDIGLWIDPIDSTNQYIHGHESTDYYNGIYKKGMQCALILIGVYDQKTGIPLVGVINQPFARQFESDGTWEGRVLWGVHHKDTRMYYDTMAPTIPDTAVTGMPRIVISASEKPEFKEKLAKEYDLVPTSGAGYKILCVVENVADAYVLTQGSTFKYDTCGPQALLTAMNGGIVCLKKALAMYNGNENVKVEEVISACALPHHQPDDASVEGSGRWANSGGLITFINPDALFKVLKLLAD